MPNVKSLIRKLQFAYRIGKIAFDNPKNQAVREIVDTYTNEMSPIAAHAQMYLEWMRNAERYSIEYKNGKIIITFEAK